MIQLTYLPSIPSNTVSDDVDVIVNPVIMSTINATALPDLNNNESEVNADNAYLFDYGDPEPTYNDPVAPYSEDIYGFGYGDANPDTVAGTDGSTPSENQQVSSDASGDEKPRPSATIPPNYYSAGRQYNPLSKFATNNYQLTLYAASPTAINALLSTSSTAIPTGMRVIAQSGGTAPRAESNNDDKTGTRTHQYDIHIDDLSITTLTSLSTAGSPLYGSYQISFKIYEPFGISFIQELRTAVFELQKDDPLPGYADTKTINTLTQSYVIGIKFYGFDENGKQLTASDFENTSENPNDPSAVFERFLIVQITQVEYTLNGKMVVYDVKGVNASAFIASNSHETTLMANVSPVGGTIKEVLLGAEDGRKNNGKGLLSYINKQQQKIKEDNKFNHHTVYDIKFEDGIFDNVSIINRREYSAVKKSAMGGNVKKSTDANIKTSQGTEVDTGVESFQFKQGDSIISCISQVIKQSMFVKNALTKYESQNPDPDAIQNASPKELRWFRIIPTVKIKARDKATNKFVYEITYHVRKYTVPYIKTPSVEKRSKFRGPVKTYKYWYGGENTEIVSYEQRFNTHFYVHAQYGSTSTPSDTNSTHAITVSKPPATETTNSLQNNDVSAVEVDLFSPGDLAEAMLKILGDPDYLVDEASRTPAFIESLKGTPMENDVMRFNPISGDSFIQIIFMTTSDYNLSTDVMPVYDNVTFTASTTKKKTKYPGIIYRLLSVQSSFSGGKFTQELKLNLVPDELLKSDEGVESTVRNETTESRTSPTAANTNAPTKKTTSTSGVSSDAVGD